VVNIQITIDTAKDSPEDIKKAIELLSSLTNSRVRSNSDLFTNTETESSSSSFSNTTSSSTNTQSNSGGVFNMFNNNPSQETKSQEQDEQEPSKVQVLKY